MQSHSTKESFKIERLQIASLYLRDKYDFRINEIKNKTEYKDKGCQNWQPIGDYNMNTWLIHIQELTDGLKPVITKVDLKILINSYFFSKEVNPVVEYFESIEAKGKNSKLSEVEKWIKSFTYNTSKDLARKYWLHWFFGTMKNLMTERYYEYMLVLIGGQGIGKSFAIQHCLAAPFLGYYTDHFSWGKTKDDIVQLAQNFIIYDDEFKATSKAEITAVKSMLCKDTISNVRVAYKEYSQDYKRIASFIACSNSDKILVDQTGNRRFLVLDIDKIDRDRINDIDYDLLWSQVWNHYHLNNNVEEIPIQTINNENEKYRIIDTEEELIKKYVDVGNSRGEYYTPFNLVKALQVFDHSLKDDEGTLRKMNSILRQKGLDQLVKKIDGKATRVWEVSVIGSANDSTQSAA